MAYQKNGSAFNPMAALLYFILMRLMYVYLCVIYLCSILKAHFVQLNHVSFLKKNHWFRMTRFLILVKCSFIFACSIVDLLKENTIEMWSVLNFRFCHLNTNQNGNVHQNQTVWKVNTIHRSKCWATKLISRQFSS